VIRRLSVPRGGGTSTGNFEISLKECSGYGASLPVGAMLGNLEGVSFARGPEGYERKALETATSLHGGSIGQLGVGSSTREFDIWLKGL
jgi:hypothetical protein